MITDGIVYGYAVHKQTDPFSCDCPRCSPSGPAVWRATGPVTASGSTGTASGGDGEDDSQPPAETPEQKLERLRDERREGVYILGALLGGTAIGMWLKGKE